MGKSGSDASLDGQKSLLKQNGGVNGDDDADDWWVTLFFPHLTSVPSVYGRLPFFRHVAYNVPSNDSVVLNGDRKRHASNISETQKSFQSRIEDLELDDTGFGRLIDWLIDWLIDQWLIYPFNDQWIDWLIDWSVIDISLQRSMDWLIDWLISDWYIPSTINGLIDWLIDWLIGSYLFYRLDWSSPFP